MMKKVLVVGIIVLFVCMSVIPSSGITIKNSESLETNKENEMLGNSPPYAPSNYYPCGELDVSVNVNLSWDGGDPDHGDTVTYDVYLGHYPNPPKIATVGPYPWNQTRIKYDPGTLEYRAPYYMKIVACDNHGASTAGPECWFITKHRPMEPLINGPTSGEAGVEYDYAFVSTDPDGDDFFYFIDWGDGTDTGWIGPYPSGEEIIRSHSWSENGIYNIRAKVKNYWGDESVWSVLPVSIGNHPPDAPTIDGPVNGKPGVEYDWTFEAIDPDGDDVRYYIDWGDGTTTDWTYRYPSGEPVTVSHTYSCYCVVTIAARAKDIYGAIGDWGELIVIVSKSSQQSISIPSSQSVIPLTANIVNDDILTNYDLPSIPLIGRKTIYVDDDNTEGPWDGTIDHPYQHIQDGVDNANWDDKVFVFNGTYLENVIVDKKMSLIGENKTTTIIDGGGIDDVVLIDGNIYGVTIRGFTIQNSGDDAWDDAGIDIHAESEGNTITGNIIRNNGWYGICCIGEWYPYYTGNNIIYDNIVINNEFGIFLDMCFYNEIYDNYVADNKYTGIFVGTTLTKANMEDLLLYEYYNDVYRNTITNNGDGIDVSLPYTNVYDNDITNNTKGILLAAPNHIECAYSNIYQNNIMNNAKGITITAGICSSATVYNNIYQNDISNNVMGITIELGNCAGGPIQVGDNNIYQNNITYNEKGISIFKSGSGASFIRNNRFYHNNFVGNTEHAYDEERNIWDNGSVGNYWDDYNGIDILPPYGIGDIPYNVPPRTLFNKDRYPLMGPWPDVSPYNNNQANQNSQSNSQQSINPLFLRFLERFPLLERLLILLIN